MKTVRRPPYPKWNPGYFPCSSLIPLPLSSRRPSVSFGGFGLKEGDSKAAAAAAISHEEYLTRYPERLRFWRPDREITDADVRAAWNAGAEKWNANYDDDGDSNRKYQSDEPMLELLGEVRGRRVLDLGCGNGYLCRKLV